MLLKKQRLHILDQDDIEKLYAKPAFTLIEYGYYFMLPEVLLAEINSTKIESKNISAKVYFILQYGYFKARHQFSKIDYKNSQEDVNFIVSHYFPEHAPPNKLPTRKVQRQTKTKLLKHFEFSDNRKSIEKIIEEKVAYLAKTTAHLTLIFDGVLSELEQQKCVLPAYSKMQDLLGAALKKEDRRLSKTTKEALKNHTRVHAALKALLKRGEVFYTITAVKSDAKSFQTKEMMAELEKISLCKAIYDFSIHFLPTLDLSRSMVNYYADLVHLYTADKLNLLPKEIVYLYMICYIHHRYERVMNNIIQGFAYYVDKYQDESEKSAKNTAPIETPIEKKHSTLGKLIQIFTNKKIMRLPGKKIEKRAFNIMPEEEIFSVSEQLIHGETNKKIEEKKRIWLFHKNNYQCILINLRPLFLAIDFEGQHDLKLLMKSVKFFKRLLKTGKDLKGIPLERIPTAHIKPEFLVSYFMEKNSTHDTAKQGNDTDQRNKKSFWMNTYQYEFYLYHSLRENLKKSKVYVNDSEAYKSFDAEIGPPLQQEQSDEMLKKLNNPILSRPIDITLNELERVLESLIERTNRRALNGENEHINITYHRNGSVEWTLPYPKRNSEIDNPFYDQLDIHLISEIYDFVANETGFTDVFTHIKKRGSKNKPDYVANKAVVLANGTTHGSHAFSKLCNIGYKRLQTAEQNNIRLATLREAANKILDCMVQLPNFQNYDINHNKHGSNDGTKKKTKRKIIKARYSSKYLGTDVGVVIMTMLMNHAPFSTRIISPNEYEGNFIFPMLSQNTSAIDPDIISTDTAGANNINDFMYYLIGKTHAPCYRSTPKKAKTICGFKSEEAYADLLIKPSKTVDKKLIKKYWPELVPMLAAILSHDVSQENVIKKLSSHEFKSELKDALWELNGILKSIHLLKYIDDIDYRRDIRTALNRGEAYHQLLAKIMAVGGGNFRGMSELEIEIWNECTRLIALIIIYYNMHLLSKLYEAAVANNDLAAIEYLKHISPVASQHIMLGGLYAFSDTPATLDLENMVKVLSRILNENVHPISAKK